MSKESVEKIRLGHIGRKTGKFIQCSFCKKETYKYPRDLKYKISFCNTECLTNWSRSHFNKRWRGADFPENLRLRNSKKYKNWRKLIWERDDYTCQICKQRGGKLNADHIKSWAKYPELRFELSNGRTLCVDCHRKTDTWGMKAIYQS